MGKIKIFSTGNEQEFNYYVIEKSQKAFEILSKILFKTLELKLPLSQEIQKNEDYKKKKLFVKTFLDKHETISGINFKRGLRADIFYGSKKMFVTILCSVKDREKFNLELLKIAEMPKPKK